MIIPSELYDVYLYDHTGALQTRISNWSRLEFHQRINNPWNHQITIEESFVDPDLINVLRNIVPDWFVVIYKTDQITGIKYKVYEGLQTTIVDQARATGDIIINLYGVGYTHLLGRRLVIPPAGTEKVIKTGAGETVLKSFVSDNMVNTVDSNRRMQGVVVEADQGRGDTITHDARYVNLMTVCQTVSENGNVDFGIVGGDSVGEFLVRAQPVWGLDRRTGNGVNLEAVFSVFHGNMDVPILSINSSDQKTWAYVGGDGQGADRLVQEVANISAVAQSPWGRKEVWVDGRQQTTASGLIVEGQWELWQRRIEENFTFNVIQNNNMRWLRDWNLGDLITARYFSHSFEKQIVEIGVAVTAGSSAQEAEEIRVEMEDI